jgi:hypothetical protein
MPTSGRAWGHVHALAGHRHRRAEHGAGAGELPAGGRVQSNGFGDRDWGGPRPPAGDNAHRDFFRLYAVGEPLPLPDRPSADDVHRALHGREQASRTLVGLYRR